MVLAAIVQPGTALSTQLLAWLLHSVSILLQPHSLPLSPGIPGDIPLQRTQLAQDQRSPSAPTHTLSLSYLYP